VTGTRPSRHRPSDERPDGSKQQKDGEPGQFPGSRRPPDHVIVVAASDWVKEHFPADRANLWDAFTPARTATATPNPTSKPNHDPTRK
jgi:hypothetical protein